MTSTHHDELSKLADEINSALSPVLPAYLQTQRWYRDKTRTIQSTYLGGLIPVSPDSYLVVAVIEYRESVPQSYLLGLSVVPGNSLPEGDDVEQAILTRFKDETGSEIAVYDAFANPEFLKALFTLIQKSETVHGQEGDIAATQTSAFARIMSDPDEELEPKLSRAQQSNSSVIYGYEFILKVFRKLEQGINPDIEIGAFLTERGFANTPAVAGFLEYRDPGTLETPANPTYVGILQQFVKNQGDAWKYTLESLKGFFEMALATRVSPPQMRYSHPMDLLPEAIGSAGQASMSPADFLGDYLASARLLGQRTAEMHAALTDLSAGPDLRPEVFSRQNAEALHQTLMDQAMIAFQLIREQSAKLTGAAAADAAKVLALQDEIRERFHPLLERDIAALCIRHHGDYHLGQVLYTGDDFLIIDFEGEPAHALENRRRKNLAMRDVAGMARSFQYAAYASLFGQVPGISVEPSEAPLLESWAGFWTAYVNAEFLKSYFTTADSLPFASPTEEERRTLFDIFLLQKALYEVGYELNNRPEWVIIPLRGILSLLT